MLDTPPLSSSPPLPEPGPVTPANPRSQPPASCHWISIIWDTAAGRYGASILLLTFALCFGSLPWTLTPRPIPGTAHADLAERPSAAPFEAQNRSARHLPPSWWPLAENSAAAKRRAAAVQDAATNQLADELNISPETAAQKYATAIKAKLPATRGPTALLGTDVLGRDLLARLLVGGAVSLSVGILAAALSVLLGTLYGATAGYIGGTVDAVMMRFVDVLYGLPYVLLVVLLAVASGAIIEEYTGRARAREAFARVQVAEVMRTERTFVFATEPATQSAALPGPAFPSSEAVRERLSADKGLGSLMMSKADSVPGLERRNVSGGVRMLLELGTLLIAIGGVSWLTMARVVRGQVLSLKAQPFIEAARAIGASRRRIFLRHLLPNLIGPIIVYATLTIPQAILQESFLSFLGIGVKPPLPSWGNLAADGLEQLNLVQSHWWLLVFPCIMLALTLLALNFVGEALRNALDPKARTRS